MLSKAQKNKEVGKHLTQQQEIFCREYVQNNCNAYAAAQTAGYSVKTDKGTNNGYAARILTIPAIVKRIAELEQEQAVYAKVTKHWVIKELVRVGREAELRGEFGAAVRALENIGRHLAMFIDKTESKTQIDVTLTKNNSIIIRRIIDDTSDLAIGPDGIKARGA